VREPRSHSRSIVHSSGCIGAISLACFFGTGCVVRTDFVPSNGSKLGYHDKSGTYEAVEEVETGAVYNSQGEKVLTKTEQQNVTHSYRELWPTQGGVKIDEESFFRIAGDQEAIKKYDQWHQDGVSRARNGGIVVGIGAAIACAGIAVLGYGLATKTDKDPKTAYQIGGGVGAGVGATMLLLGIPLIGSGKSQATAEEGALFQDASRYRADAKRYNREHHAR
jgi:hypothetical protein